MRENLDKESLEVSEALPEFYVPYASYVIQTRALPDIKDGLKAGARFILYAQYKNKITYKNKRRKGTATKSAAMMYSPHGDASIYANAVRMSQSFSLRYPLIDTHGNNGSMMNNGDFAADRYLEMRSGKIADEMTKLLPKETVDKWKLNYTEEELYPTYLPSTFPNLLVNGNFGIAVGLSSSIPSHNLNDVSEALIKIIDNPDASFEEVYCPIDFPTGGIIINENEVKESLKNGHGRAAIVRAVIDYDDAKNELIVKELPYMVFSANATESIQAAIDEEVINGIDSVFDGTDYDGVKIVIKLNKGANPERITKLLYKHTVLQNSFSINMNALDENTRPKMFTWVELLKGFVSHLNNVIRKSFEFDLKQLKERIHILEGLITAILNIEEVVDIIKKSATSSAAKASLCDKFKFSDKQAEAILALKLSRLANLELKKLEDEKKEREIKKDEIEKILSDKTLFDNEVKKEIRYIQHEYADERKSKNINLEFSSKDDDAEPIEEKQLLISLTNLNNIYTQESSTLIRSRRGAKGSKVKLSANETVEKTLTDSNLGTLLAFTNRGQLYHAPLSELSVGTKINLSQLFSFESGEYLTALTTIQEQPANSYFIFITKNGMIKKTSAAAYNVKKGKAVKAINLKDGDEVVNVLFTQSDNVGILTNNGNFIRIATDEIAAIGRAATGIKAITLTPGDYVIDAKIIKSSDKFLLTLSEAGLIKKMELNEFDLCSRATKGKRISAVKDTDKVLKFLTIPADCDIIVSTKQKTLKISTADIKVQLRSSIGLKSIDLAAQDKAVNVQRDLNGN